jgi:hypothetical protein
MTTYSLRGWYQHCGGMCCLHRLGIAVLNFVKLCCFCKIWDFYSGVFKNCGHLKCDVALLGKWLVIFWRNVLMWTLNPLRWRWLSFKMSDTTHPVIQCHITDDTYSSMAQEIQLFTHMKWVCFISVWADSQCSHLYYSCFRFLQF